MQCSGPKAPPPPHKVRSLSKLSEWPLPCEGFQAPGQCVCHVFVLFKAFLHRMRQRAGFVQAP